MTFDRHGMPGVELRLISARQDWASQALWQITKEVGRGKPSWSWVNTNGGMIAFFFAITVSVYLVSVPFLLATNLDSVLVLSISTVVAFASAVAGTLLTNLRPWLFPPFEILADGQVAKGSRRLASFGALGVAVAVSFCDQSGDGRYVSQCRGETSRRQRLFD